MGLIGCPEISVQDYHCTLRNITEGRISLKSLFLLLPAVWGLPSVLCRGYQGLYLQINVDKARTLLVSSSYKTRIVELFKKWHGFTTSDSFAFWKRRFKN